MILDFYIFYNINFDYDFYLSFLFVSFLSRFYALYGDVLIVINQDEKREVSVDLSVEILLLQLFRLPELSRLLLVNRLMRWIITMGLILVN
jgi:hypothetical protein